MGSCSTRWDRQEGPPIITSAEVISFLDELLACEKYSESAVNGAQVRWDGRSYLLNDDSDHHALATVMCAVDACVGVAQDAVSVGAKLIVVHHGIWWGQPSGAITGSLAELVRILATHQIALYAAHLPLDGHAALGNNALLGRALGLIDIVPWFKAGQNVIGARGIFANPVPFEVLQDTATSVTNCRNPTVFPFGPPGRGKLVRTVGLLTGSGSIALEAARADGLDVLISGEPKQEAFHRARDLDQAALFVGHYATETWGVCALGAALQRHFASANLRVVYSDRPTGI